MYKSYYFLHLCVFIGVVVCVVMAFLYASIVLASQDNVDTLIRAAEELPSIEDSSHALLPVKKLEQQTENVVVDSFSSDEDEGGVSLLFVGDIMLDRHVRTLIEKNGVRWLVEPVEHLFTLVDGAVGNLEGPITNSPSVSRWASQAQPNHFRFTFDSAAAMEFLTKNRFLAVSLANNHSYNFGTMGLVSTTETLQKTNILSVGNPDDAATATQIIDRGGQKIAIVAYQWFGKPTFDDALTAVTAAAQDSTITHIVVFPHWGVEYAFLQHERQTREAHLLIDTGADLVIGAHPHVVQPLEVYQNRVIAYSLGNFVFDQYFDVDVRTRLAVTAKFHKKSIALSPHLLIVEKSGQLRTAQTPEYDIVIYRITKDLPDMCQKKAREQGEVVVSFDAGCL